eukprot:TRINITY_DN8222_c0_g1_i2.p1 TRINITY_DN8222_c0_g1~~TRINITY_DN8222_c0_g1_i2.p1  ORF type:complete len:526 (-),score=95.00 TRINITY_DN8222_c0_g1_i2:110-1687(-)
MKRSSSIEQWLGDVVARDTPRVMRFQRMCGVQWLDDEVQPRVAGPNQMAGAAGSCNDLQGVEARILAHNKRVSRTGGIVSASASSGGSASPHTDATADASAGSRGMRRTGSMPAGMFALGHEEAARNLTKKERQKLKKARRRSKKLAESNRVETHGTHTHGLSHSYANVLLHLIFRMGSFFGEEAFYLTFLPNLGWTISYKLTRQLLSLMCVMYFIGQLLKDTLKLPRPPSPPVVRLEYHFAEEYGLPSTHAMAAVSVPFFIAYSLTPSWEDFSSIVTGPIRDGHIPWALWGISPLYWTLVLLWGAASWWFITMTLSRLYMGVHSVPDLVAGFLLGAVSLLLGLRYAEAVDNFLVTAPLGGIVACGFTVGSAILYALVARPSKWTPCFGDTVLLISVGCGVALGSRISEGDLHYSSERVPCKLLADAFSAPSTWNYLLGDHSMMSFVGVWVLRSVVAYFLLFLARMVAKMVAFNAFQGVLRRDDPKHSYVVEIPTKIVTYTCVGLAATALIPRVFSYYGWVRSVV